jgi:hypothetical protein
MESEEVAMADNERCAYPRCRERIPAGAAVNYMGRRVCGRHWEQIGGRPAAEIREVLGIRVSGAARAAAQEANHGS